MGKQKMTPIGIACILLVLLVVAFMVRGSLREPEVKFCIHVILFLS